MPPAVHRIFTASLAALLLFAWPVAADSYPFRHSPNANRAQSQYIEDIGRHKDRFHEMLEAAGNRFILTSERQIQRYATAMNREVRNLTRAGEIKPAYAVRAVINSTENWEISPPDSAGFHFLNKADLSVEGSDKANELGVDLMVDVEKAGVLFGEQAEAAYEQYVAQVAESRKTLIESLDRVANIEQDAGRLDALREVKQAIESFKALADPPRPDKIKEGRRDKQQETTRPEQEQPLNKRTEIFEGIHGEPDQQATAPKPLNKAGDAPWAGYYLLKYSINGRHGIRFVVKLDTTGGTLVMTARDSKGDERVNHAIPIEIVSHDDTKMLIKHKSDMIEGATMHVIDLVNGSPASCRTWWSEVAYTRNDEPAQTGQACRMGNPDADLLGLADGVYLAKLAQTRNKANRQEAKTIQFEITVDAGHVMISRHNMSTNENKWSEWHAFMLLVQTTGSELVMTYDSDEFDWADLFVIDMSDKTKPALKHWWRGDWRARGDEPSAVGELVKQ